MDTVLLVAPSVAMAFAPHRSSRWLARFALGLLPFFAWELFSVAYYGAFVPNTAYAKLLSTGLGHRELASQAVLYFRDSLSRDPVTLGKMYYGQRVQLSETEDKPFVVVTGDWSPGQRNIPLEVGPGILS